MMTMTWVRVLLKMMARMTEDDPDNHMPNVLACCPVSGLRLEGFRGIAFRLNKLVSTIKDSMTRAPY